MLKVRKPILTTIVVIVGLLYFISGIIKLNDPLGFSYKLQEYFSVFGLSFLSNIATTFSIIIGVLEVSLALFLLLGIYRIITLKGLLFSILFFTLLTFISAAFKLVTDCGCFGEVLIISPWLSFFKDVIIFILIWLIYKNQNELPNSLIKEKSTKIAAFIIVNVGLILGIFTFNFLPFIDFSAFKKGVNLMEIGGSRDEYEIIYLLKNIKSGEEKQLNQDDYNSSGIWKDKDWEIFGEPTRNLTKKGKKNSVQHLIIRDEFSTDYTQELLGNPYYNLIIVAPDLGDVNINALGNMNALTINVAEQFNIRSILLTSSLPKEANDTAKNLKLFPLIFYADGSIVKSIVRSKPGLVLLKDGIIIDKWHFNNMPKLEELTQKYFNQ
ncbi:BT_3928 family protein [Pedobacter flavus]|uniref:BT_3928 family protein n=1 Tax=Pedobacter flavus TaxID=3113906 RepID=A0ABU7GYC1_9SPHI|nr:BT_3928 family protein [Pedobacter sp. VNH31]MEE1884014.1 BT_3928 family protein [Pedobacter sp. VNH31]